MVNYNENIQQNSGINIEDNRGFLFGDSVFETLKVVKGTVLFLEDHYFRLMASMRICRMEIPMNFTMEYIEHQVLNLVQAVPPNDAFRVRFSVFRTGEGYYLPQSNAIDFLVTAKPLPNPYYDTKTEPYEIELYKDAYITKQLFSTLKTNNKIIYTAGSIFARENNYDNCLILNDEKNVVEALQSNIFVRMGKQLTTPPVSDGCLNGIMRKQILALAKKIEEIEVLEKSVSPFDLQKADEIFLTNVVSGIQPVTKYRKKTFEIKTAVELTTLLNQ